MLRICDCGACCNTCGHDAECGVFEPLPKVSKAELVARANENPGSFLAFLLGTPESGAA